MSSSGIWLICPGCGLQHTPRPDGRCPRCKFPSAAPEPDAAGATWRPPSSRPAPAAPSDAVTTGARVAGWFMIVNGLVGAVGALRLASQAGSSSTVGAAGGLVAAALGAGIAAGRELPRKIAIGLVCVALLAVLLAGVATGAWVPCGAAALLCLANLALLVGDPGPARIVAAAAVVAAGCVAGVAAALDPGAFAGKVLAWSGAYERAPVTEASGPDWRLSFPSGRWYRAKKPPDAGGGPPPDVSFLRPEGPAWASVLAVNVPGLSSVDVDRTAQLGSAAVGAKFDRWNLLEVSPLPGRGGTRVLHGVATQKAQEVEVLAGLFPNGPLFHVVVVGAAPPAFARLRDELTEVLASFHSDSLPMPRAPTPFAVPASPVR